MTEECDPGSQIKDFLAGLKSNANFPNLKNVIGKLSTLPGVSQVKGIHVQMLRVQSELLKGQLMILEQCIQALEAAPAPPEAEPAAATPAGNGKIAVT